MATRADWNRIVEPTLRVAMAADFEGRRRDPWHQREPLHSAEPDPELQGTDDEILAALGLTADAPEVSDHPARAAAKARELQPRLDEIAAMAEPAEDPDHRRSTGPPSFQAAGGRYATGAARGARIRASGRARF